MSKLVPAYDTRTGDKIPHEVPEHWIGHPTFGPYLSMTPRAKKVREKQETETPATGETPKE